VYVVPEGENESTVKPIQLLINEIEAVAPTGGKRKWPFYGRRSTRRQRGGVEQSAIDKAKADYDKATTDLDNYNTQINKSIRIRDTYPVEKRGEDAYKINESIANDTATINTIVTDLKQKQASAYATYLALQKTIETEREQSKVNDPFNENYVPPPQPPFRPTLMDNGVPVQRPTNLNFFNPPSMPGSSFDAGENKRQFNEAIRARDEKTRLQLEQNQKDIVAKQVQDERIQKEAVARVRKERERFQKELIKKEEKVKAEDAKKAEKIATKNARIDTQNAESNKIWSEYIKKYDQWKLVKDTYNVCLQEYRKALEKHKEACDKLIRAKAKQLGDDQIMRLQSRTVGSSLMLDEARKLMNDADELQRTVMASKTDLQFTLTSSSDADIAKIVGLYETEIQKLKTCISRGKEDAIAEYDKDLAEIEKRKREVTTKVFDVKSEQPQGSNDLSSLPVAELNQRISQVNSTISKLRSNGKSTIGEEKYLSKLRNALQAPKQGGRRMTMRHRRV
jgi:hypothetical protein